MAACGSLQQIFEKPLPEKTTFLETLTSWNQTVNPTQQSSFTEIFGELHFKESTLFLPSPSSPPLLQNLQEEKHEISENDDVSSKAFHRRSNSFSSTNSESLQHCTEGLGFESLDDVEDMKRGEDEQWEEDEVRVSEDPLKTDQQTMRKLPRSTKMEDFPPPISCMGKSGKPCVGLKSYRYDGRFILKEIRVPTHEFMHACRENGRLKLHILVPNKENERGDEEEDEKEGNEIILEDDED